MAICLYMSNLPLDNVLKISHLVYVQEKLVKYASVVYSFIGNAQICIETKTWSLFVPSAPCMFFFSTISFCNVIIFFESVMFGFGKMS